MDESQKNWLSYLLFDEIDDCNLLTGTDSLVEVFNGNSSVQAELCCKSHSCDSILTKENTTLLNNMNNSSSLEENTGFDNSTGLIYAFSENPLFSSSMPCTLSFEDSTAVPYIPDENSKDHTQEEPGNNRKSKRGRRSSSQIQYHIMEERKRRENIARMIIELSAIIPGLRKIDKASVLENAIDYVKCLQKRVKDLEEQNKKRNIKSLVCFKMNKPIDGTVTDDFSCIPNGLDKPTKVCPKVEARVSAKDVFIRVLCKKEKDIVPKLMAKLQALNLSIVCSNVLPFGNSTLIITTIAQMDHQFRMTMDELVKVLIENLLECCNCN